MSQVTISLDTEISELVGKLQQPAEEVARGLIVLELFRQGVISSGKGAEILGMSRIEFIQFATDRGVPFFTMSDEEWNQEAAQIETLSANV